ncbi:MAG: hypothetical protein U0905_21465 [Pirellulales bacterium]
MERISLGARKTSSRSTPASQAGRHHAIAKVRDEAGNEATTSLEWNVRDPNNAAPRIEIHQPTGEQTLKGLYPVIASIRDADSDLIRVQLEIKSSDGNDPWRIIHLMQASLMQHEQTPRHWWV